MNGFGRVEISNVFSFTLGFQDCLASNFDEIFIEPKWVQPIITSPRSIVLPKNGPYTATFDKFIVRAYDTGLLHKAKYQYQFRDGKYSKYVLFNTIRILYFLFYLDVIDNFDWKKSADDSTQKPLTLKPFIAIFSLSGVFYLVSIIVFLFEILKK